MSQDHYFSAEPASADERRLIRVTLGGRDVDVETASGVFSPGHIDLGTQVLLRHVPDPPATLVDVGCGWGPLSLEAALRSPGTHVTAVDVNPRALDLLRRNAERLGLADRITAVTPADIDPGMHVDALWSNPPIRIGKDALHDVLTTWIPRIAPGGQAHLVVQRNLGADSLAAWMAAQRDASGEPWGEVSRIGSAKGFRVLRVVRGGVSAQAAPR